MNAKKARLAEIVGPDRVIDDPGIGESFSLDRTLHSAMRPSFKVRPGTAEQVREIVLWANETLTPLVPVSSGAPHLRGGTLPSVPEAVIVDLAGMKRILKIDRRNRLALLEPGVTYSQLQPELQKEGLRVIMPLLPRANKSVIASLLEREPPMSPRYQWNLLEPLRSLEIVWGNGDRFYSGSGTFRGEREEDWQQGLVPVQGPGPGQLDFYKLVSAAQGSMGIVTWASVKCEVHPDLRKLFLVPAERLADLIDFTYRLLRFRFGDELFLVNNACLAYILAQDADKAVSLRNTLPPWTAVVGITGGQVLPREKVQARQKDIQELAQQSGLALVPALRGCREGELLALILNASAEPYWKLRYKGGAQEIFFLSTLDRAAGYVATMQAAADEQQYPISDIGIYIQPVHQGVGCHCEFILPFDRDSQAESVRAEALLRDASHRLFGQKAFFSRPYGIWADMVYGADERTKMVTQKVKDIFDPNHLMNPGKLCL
jgi:FAD/FMN-containing dehydrogenase